jgi:hypothetical protein
MIHVDVGYDAGKQIKGRKPHVLVDTLGLLIMVVVTAASMPEREGAKLIFAPGESIEKTIFSFNQDLGRWRLPRREF